MGKGGEDVATFISQVGGWGHRSQGTTGPALVDTVTQGLSLEWALVTAGSPTQNSRGPSPGNFPPPSGHLFPVVGEVGGGMGRLSGRFSWGGGRGCSSLWGRAVPTCGALTCEEADTPQARVQGHLDLRALVLGQDHPLLQVEPVVGADCDAQEPQAADGKDAAQQGQRLPPAAAHLPRGRRAACGQGSGLWKQEWGGELTVAATALRRPRCGAWGRKLKSTPSG